ncbi:MAG: MraY family glycosyltransferase [Candidatus Omnitrophota bacterium]|jgi:UDP-GlcNAc:undecaprenyl-phosphate GlcNAc-1-phosphate transferase
MLILVFFISAIATIAFILFLRKFPAITNGFMQQGVPAIGGLSIGAIFFILAPAIFLQAGIFSKEAQGILLASFFMFIFGIIDDKKRLSVTAKAIMQIIAALILVVFGVKTRIIYIGDAANTIITLIWVIGITNSFNHLDIMDGLAAVAAVICIAAFLFLAALKTDIFLITLAAILIGGLSGFLRYNLPQAKVYLGNTGSHFIGFIIAAMAITISYAPIERKIALISPLLILGLPIFDTAFVIFVRMLKGKLPFMKSNDHIATRLLRIGLSKWQALLLMAGWGMLCAFSGVSLTRLNLFPGLLLIAAVLMLSLTVFLYAARVTIND